MLRNGNHKRSAGYHNRWYAQQISSVRNVRKKREYCGSVVRDNSDVLTQRKLYL